MPFEPSLVKDSLRVRLWFAICTQDRRFGIDKPLNIFECKFLVGQKGLQPNISDRSFDRQPLCCELKYFGNQTAHRCRERQGGIFY